MFLTIRDMPVANVQVFDILLVMQSIWRSKPETASGVLQQIQSTIKSAILGGFCDLACPTIGVVEELDSSNVREAEHCPAMVLDEVPDFIKRLSSWPRTMPTMRLAFEFLMLTACRSGE